MALSSSDDTASSSGHRQDHAWDAFLARAPGGHYLQSAVWARFKASVGWASARLVVTEGEDVVAGVQLLTREMPVVGGVAYAPRGPVDASGDREVERWLLRALHRFCRARRLRYIAIQPASYDVPIADELRDWGYEPTKRVGAATATMRVDLTADPDDILAAMSKSTRRNVRRSKSRGLTAREGTEEDLPAFYRLLSAASERKGIAEYPESYYAEQWRQLAPRGHLKMFLVEHGDELVSAQLAIVFGATTHAYKMAWSGEHGDRKPNELLDWTTMMWAKAAGCDSYDFEGVDRSTARAAGRGAPAHKTTTPASDTMATGYKLGFGGTIDVLPETHDYVHNPALRWAYHRALPRIEERIDVSRPLGALKHLAGGQPA